jgi:hypothetical protein
MLLHLLWSFLTVLFFVGLSGSSIVVVLFLIELFRTVFRGEQDPEDEVIPTA